MRSVALDLLRSIMLTPALMMKDLDSFGLERNEFVNCTDGIRFAIQCIQNSPNLESLQWGNNLIDSVDDASYLSSKPSTPTLLLFLSIFWVVVMGQM